MFRYNGLRHDRPDPSSPRIRIPEARRLPPGDRPSRHRFRRLRREGGNALPPEPNGFLHIATPSRSASTSASAEFGGVCHLRFDDTNPETEDVKYVESIRRDVRWLGFDWKEKIFFASDYYEQLYELAVRLIRDGKAYVDSQTDEEIRKGRGTITEPGVHGPYRTVGWMRILISSPA